MSQQSSAHTHTNLHSNGIEETAAMHSSIFRYLVMASDAPAHMTNNYYDLNGREHHCMCAVHCFVAHYCTLDACDNKRLKNVGDAGFLFVSLHGSSSTCFLFHGPLRRCILKHKTRKYEVIHTGLIDRRYSSNAHMIPSSKWEKIVWRAMKVHYIEFGSAPAALNVKRLNFPSCAEHSSRCDVPVFVFVPYFHWKSFVSVEERCVLTLAQHKKFPFSITAMSAYESPRQPFYRARISDNMKLLRSYAIITRAWVAD